jgi:hypothetical protein
LKVTKEYGACRQVAPFLKSKKHQNKSKLEMDQKKLETEPARKWALEEEE